MKTVVLTLFWFLVFSGLALSALVALVAKRSRSIPRSSSSEMQRLFQQKVRNAGLLSSYRAKRRQRQALVSYARSRRQTSTR